MVTTLVLFGEYDMVGVKLPEHKVCDPDTFTEAGNWKDCGTKGWPATGWAKDYTMNYGNPATFAKAEHADAKKFFENMSLQNIDQAKMLVEVDQEKRCQGSCCRMVRQQSRQMEALVKIKLFLIQKIKGPFIKGLFLSVIKFF